MASAPAGRCPASGGFAAPRQRPGSGRAQRGWTAAHHAPRLAFLCARGVTQSHRPSPDRLSRCCHGGHSGGSSRPGSTDLGSPQKALPLSAWGQVWGPAAMHEPCRNGAALCAAPAAQERLHRSAVVWAREFAPGVLQRAIAWRAWAGPRQLPHGAERLPQRRQPCGYARPGSPHPTGQGKYTTLKCIAEHVASTGGNVDGSQGCPHRPSHGRLQRSLAPWTCCCHSQNTTTRPQPRAPGAVKLSCSGWTLARLVASLHAAEHNHGYDPQSAVRLALHATTRSSRPVHGALAALWCGRLCPRQQRSAALSRPTCRSLAKSRRNTRDLSDVICRGDR